jgi:hypothetical protein
MADDENVTELPQQQNQQKGKKTPQSILAEIKNQFMSKKATEFKNKATAAMEEVDKLEKALALKRAELDKLVKEYEAEIS